MGKDKARAFAAAKKLNALLLAGNDLVAKVVAPKETIAHAITVFRAEDIPERGWKERTAAEYEITVRRIERLIGTRPVEGFTVKDCATFIDTTTDSVRGRQQLRLVLGWILQCAIQKGWAESNVALQTRKPKFKRKRERLTLDIYSKIWALAPGWLRIAMDISLITLMRRDDVVLLKFSDVRDGSVWVVPNKSDTTTELKLQIKLTPQLTELFARARDNVVSPFIVHRLPEKARPSDMRAKDRTHHTQVMAEQLTRAFADVRDAAGIGGENPPTFHEIRSLGGALLRTESGWTRGQVKELMGHTEETTTQIYLNGHDTPWTEVTPGLTLPIHR